MLFKKKRSNITLKIVVVNTESHLLELKQACGSNIYDRSGYIIICKCVNVYTVVINNNNVSSGYSILMHLSVGKASMST